MHCFVSQKSSLQLEEMHVFDRSGSVASFSVRITPKEMHVFDQGGSVASFLPQPKTHPRKENQEKPLVHIGHNPPRHNLAVPLPILPILPPALLFIPPLPVHQQHREIHHEEVRDEHAPSLRLPRNHVLLVAILEEHGIRLGCLNRVGGRVLNEVSRCGGRQHIRPRHEPIA